MHNFFITEALIRLIKKEFEISTSARDLDAETEI